MVTYHWKKSSVELMNHSASEGLSMSTNNMFEKVKAQIRLYWELSWGELTELKSWLKARPSPCPITQDTLASPHLCVGTAKDGNATIAHVLIEPCLVVAAFAISPTATSEQKYAAGSKLDDCINSLGAQWGISKCLMLSDIPIKEDDGVREIKNVWLYERTIPQATSNMMGNKSPSTNATKYLN